MRMSAGATKLGYRLFYGDFQSEKQVLPFRLHVETRHALPRPEEMASREEFSYFEEGLFQQPPMHTCFFLVVAFSASNFE